MSRWAMAGVSNLECRPLGITWRQHAQGKVCLLMLLLLLLLTRSLSLSFTMASSTHRKVPQRIKREAPAEEELSTVQRQGTADWGRSQGRDTLRPGVWGSWSHWSECSRSCGIGVQERQRDCRPPPNRVPDRNPSRRSHYWLTTVRDRMDRQGRRWQPGRHRMKHRGSHSRISSRNGREGSARKPNNRSIQPGQAPPDREVPAGDGGAEQPMTSPSQGATRLSYGRDGLPWSLDWPTHNKGGYRRSGGTAAFSLYTDSKEASQDADERTANVKETRAADRLRRYQQARVSHSRGLSRSRSATATRAFPSSIHPGKYGYGKMPVVYSAIRQGPPNQQQHEGEDSDATHHGLDSARAPRPFVDASSHGEASSSQHRALRSRALRQPTRMRPKQQRPAFSNPNDKASHWGRFLAERSHTDNRLQSPQPVPVYSSKEGFPAYSSLPQSRNSLVGQSGSLHKEGMSNHNASQPARSRIIHKVHEMRTLSHNQHGGRRRRRQNVDQRMFNCSGDNTQSMICNAQVCPPGSVDVREFQCASYNGRPFMGKHYEWVPFLEVRKEQKCELNCRAVGYRFYVRHAERVEDGTLCEPGGSKVCLRGTCKALGCDGFLGSGKVLDKCGVCGGDDTTCKVISGIYKRSASSVGYHKILEIPSGATKINITEMTKSRNYLALRSHNGKSIINGNWAIDRPGKYEAAGTMFMYKRPNEISSTTGESFFSDGPTNDILNVFMIYQQPNPGVHFEYVLLSDNIVRSQLDPSSTNQNKDVAYNGQLAASASNSRIDGVIDHASRLSIPVRQTPAGTDTKNGWRHGSEVAPVPPAHVQSQDRVPGQTTMGQTDPGGHVEPSYPSQEFSWKRVGASECSSTCGRGKRLAIVHCVRKSTQEEVGSVLCDSSTKPKEQEEPCNIQPCPAFWDVGEWSECSKTCGTGKQHRQVLCRQLYAGRITTVHPHRCRSLERPETTTTCQLRICSEWRIRKEWSTCSVPCGVGQRTRDVKCISNIGDVVDDHECNMKLRPGDSENCDMGPCTRSWFFTDWSSRCSAECGKGEESRSVVCLMNHVNSLPLKECGGQRPAENRSCNKGSCENLVSWFTAPWGQCSVECGNGTQSRDIICIQRSNTSFLVLAPSACSHLEKPPSHQACKSRTCGMRWFSTAWSACSKSCEGGFRVREVRCLADDLSLSMDCPMEKRPEDRETCNVQPCVPKIDEHCKDKYFNCNVVVQARLCVYDYYQRACCASCKRASTRTRRFGR
uniref:Thrombospondin type 1 domain containing 4 n=1 Tax=Eptatretus burgeri TaxID=7764 RepID=A0A8C4QRM7_EPTBU